MISFSYSFTQAAKLLDTKPKKFIEYLVKHRYIYRDGNSKFQAYSQYISRDLFVIVEFLNHKTGFRGYQTRITEKGRVYFSNKIENDNSFKHEQ